MPVPTGDVDPVAVARWFWLEGERLGREAEAAQERYDRECERIAALVVQPGGPLSPDEVKSRLGEDACDLLDAAYRRWWWHNDEFGAALFSWLEREAARRHARELREVGRWAVFGDRPWF